MADSLQILMRKSWAHFVQHLSRSLDVYCLNECHMLDFNIIIIIIIMLMVCVELVYGTSI